MKNIQNCMKQNCMKNIQNTIAYICNLAMKRTSAEGLFHIRDFMKPSNWEMKIFSEEDMKRYVLWNTCVHPDWNTFFHLG